MGLSTYMVFMQGESKPASHMSRTGTNRSGSLEFRGPNTYYPIP